MSEKKSFSGLATGAAITVSAQPFDFVFEPARTALVMIDMQRDFVERGGFGESLGNDVSHLERVVAPARALLDWARANRLTIVHTRECHRPDLSDCPPGAEFVPQLAPLAGEIEIVKPGKGAFYGTRLQSVLEAGGITHLIFGGVTTEVCVQTTMREANDRGYECLLIEEATGSYFPEFYRATLAMIAAQGGIVGWTAGLAALVDAGR